MKIKLFLFLALLITVFNSNAQNSKSFGQVKPYIAIIKTKDSTVKGLFIKIDSQKVIVYWKDKYTELNTAAVKSIKLRVTKADYELQSYIFKYVKTDKKDRVDKYHINQQGKRVDEWGREEPSFGEEVGGAIMGAVVGTVGEIATNIVVGSLHNINPNIANYKFKNGINSSQLEELSYFSTTYQLSPNIIAESQKIKNITAGFKP